MGKRMLVIGGSGMLRNAVLQFSEMGAHMAVVGRNRSRLESLVEQSIKSVKPIIPLKLDYTNQGDLQEQLQACQDKFGSFDIVVAWIHSHAVESHETILQSLNPSQSIPYYVLKGSASYNPANSKATWELFLERNQEIHFREIILGFQIENGHSRWLTHEEISNGTVEAILNNQHKQIIGRTEPWNLRP